MQFKTRLQEALGNLVAHTLRSFLALLGILVGTASVLAIVSGGQLATEQALKQYEQLGTDLLAVSIYYDYAGPGKAVDYLELPEIADLMNKTNGIGLMAPYVATYVPVSLAGKSLDAGVAGIGDDFPKIAKLTLIQGRPISLMDESEYFCVLGNKIYQSFGTKGSVIGRQILVGSQYFTIVGVIDEIENNPFLNVDMDNTVFIPLKTAHILSKDAYINHILIKTKAGVNTVKLRGEIEAYINARAKVRLYFDSSDLIVKNMKKQRQIFTVFLGFIGGISLLVGGIGVMNIMLISISERRQEIGIRMAVGANRWDIMLLFLTEAIILALFGGILGVTLGEIITFAIAEVKHWQFHVFFFPPLLGFCVSMVTGVFFGFYPAVKASKLRPIETLRAE